jgi:type II secretory pathway component PulM
MLQPTGSFTANVTNQTTAIDTAVAAGGLSAPDGDAVKSAMASSAKLASDGRPVQDMRIENSQLKIGPTEIGALPRIMWP